MKSEQYYLDKYKPILYLHYKESISPISWEDYLKNSISIENDRINFIGKSIVPDKKNINDIPFYGKVNFNDNDYFIDLVYIFLYPINKGYKIAFWNDIGYHTGDIEHIIIRINKYTEKIIKVFFSAHSKEHTIHYLKDLSLCNHCNTLKVYVALNSHANYVKPKTYFRIFGFANDKTSNKGIYWHPTQVINIDTMNKTNYKSIGLTKSNKFSVRGLFRRNFKFIETKKCFLFYEILNIIKRKNKFILNF